MSQSEKKLLDTMQQMIDQSYEEVFDRADERLRPLAAQNGLPHPPQRPPEGPAPAPPVEQAGAASPVLAAAAPPAEQPEAPSAAPKKPAPPPGDDAASLLALIDRQLGRKGGKR